MIIIKRSYNVSMDASLIFLLLMHLAFLLESKAHGLEFRSYSGSLKPTIYMNERNHSQHGPKRVAATRLSHMFHANSTLLPKDCDELCVGRIRSKHFSQYVRTKVDRGRNLVAAAGPINLVWLNNQKVVEWYVTIDVTSTNGQHREQKVMLVPDTSSSLTWFQCKPCQCFPQRWPVYDRTIDAGVYRDLNEGDDFCQKVQTTIYRNEMTPTSCSYFARYGDTTSSAGAVASTGFRLRTLDGSGYIYLPNVGFGCGSYNTAGTGTGLSGVLGLARLQGVSLPEQLSDFIGESFAFCLPIVGSRPDSGWLVFGDDAMPGLTADGYQSVIFPAGGYENYFYLDAVDMFVGTNGVNIPPGTLDIRPDRTGGVLIDSGTMVSLMLPEAYVPFRDAYRSAMRSVLGEARLHGKFGMDTCYDVTNIELETLPLPSTGFILRNGSRFPFGRIASFFTYYTGSGRPVLCLPILPFRPPKEFSILGAYQMMQTTMAFDHVRNRLSWSSNTC
ncbi:hypothetical protein Mapa_010658 [Marchantia paleacea]|nr:hypothetical protein Mapa_010658 [Marchantia paleacea]